MHVVDWVYGTFVAVRRAVFDALGGFDGSYFLYGEDLDLCHRAHALGWRTLLVPAARATHARNVSYTTRSGLAATAVVERAAILRAPVGAGAAQRYRVSQAKFGARRAAAAGRADDGGARARVVRVCLGAGGTRRDGPGVHDARDPCRTDEPHSADAGRSLGTRPDPASRPRRSCA